MLRGGVYKVMKMHVLIYLSFSSVVLGAYIRSTSHSALPILLHEAQSHLSAPRAHTHNEHHVSAGFSLPVKVTQTSFTDMFTTNIQLGTPGQTLPVLLDLNWNDLFVPSSDCRTYFCFGRPKYNATSSSTHSTNGTRTDIRFWIMGTRGVKSADTIHLGSLSIHDFIFEEALTIGGEMWPDENAPLSVLGLSRVSYDTTWSNLSSLNPFQRAVTDKALTRPLFSLQLPKSEQDVGELLFGSVNPKHTHGITAVLPISDVVINHNIANESVNGGWHVQAQHARYGDDIFSDLSGRTAVYTTLFKELGLPHELAEIMQAKIGDNLLEVPCARRHELPDFVIRLGSDDETFDFVLTPEDYIRDNPSSGLGCRTIFVDIEEENNDNLILLGSYFIDCFYHVFNAGNMTISLSEYDHQAWDSSIRSVVSELKTS